MARLRMGSIEFINSLPVDLGIATGAVSLDADVVQGPPSKLNEMMRTGDLDVSAISAFAFARQADQYLLLPNLSISSESGVQSVLLFSDGPWESLKGRKIVVTGQGRTTPALLEILCRFKLGFEPQIEFSPRALKDVLEKRAAAALLIGDQALVARAGLEGAPDAPLVYDLAEEWKAWTGMPIVFAVWAARRAAFAENPDGVLRAHAALLQSRQWGLENPEAVLLAAQKKSGLPRATLQSYYAGLSYGFGDNLKKGMALYFEYAKKAGFLERMPQIEELPPAAGRPLAGNAR